MIQNMKANIRSQLIANRFHLQRRLGEGTFAEVWQAVDTQIQLGHPPEHSKQSKHYVALKIFRPDSFSRVGVDWAVLRNEIAAAYWLSPHPNLICAKAVTTAVHFGSVATPCLILDYVEAVNLAEFLQSLPAPSLNTLPARLQVMTALLEALAHCHARGVAHRDLSFGNLLVCPNQPAQSKLTDFGSSQIQNSPTYSSDWSSSTDSLQPINHPPYTGSLTLPEEFKRDLYGFAVLCYLTLSGRHPLSDDWQSMRTGQWQGASHPHFNLPRRSLLEVAPWLAASLPMEPLASLLLSCLSPELAARPASAICVWAQWQRLLS